MGAVCRELIRDLCLVGVDQNRDIIGCAIDGGVKQREGEVAEEAVVA